MKILVVGDSCQDRYIYGTCDRLCPAAPVPVFVPSQIVSNPGMAGNVVENLRHLGIKTDFITNAEKIIKTRYVEEKTNQMILRVDEANEKIRRVKGLEGLNFSSYDAVVISDYDKGFLLEEDIEFLGQNNSIVFLDTKKLISDWAFNCSFVKINHIEYEKTKHLLENSQEWVNDHLIVTRGSSGCSYKQQNFPVEKVEIRDLCGAGDTFLSGLVAQYIHTTNINDSIVFANKCATDVVQKKGVSLPTNYKDCFK